MNDARVTSIVCSPAETKPDAAARFSAYKRGGVRRASRERAAEEPWFLGSLWRHRAVWLLPLVAETMLLVAAANLALALGKVIQGDALGVEWIWVTGACVIFAGCRLLCALCELFMPRFVALMGLGVLFLVSLGFLIGLLVPEPWHPVFADMEAKTRLLAAVPLGLFMLRVYMVFRAARFSPALRDMDRYTSKGWGGLMEKMKTRLEFWMR